MKKRIITATDLAAHKLPDKIAEKPLRKSRRRYAHTEALAVRSNPGDDAAMLYTHERMIDLERRMVGVLSEYRNLLDVAGTAVAEAKEAKTEALRERAARQVLQGELRAYVRGLHEVLIGICGVGVPMPEFDVEKILEKSR